jgi:5-methyltetrahydrofolate--homocysteine methyltransferase
MTSFLDALRSRRALLMDGAMGAELQKLGLKPEECGEEWNLTHPERVASVHRAYAEAGAEVLLTNTFQAIGSALERRGCRLPPSRVVYAAIGLAREQGKWVLGDIGPFEDVHRFDERKQKCIWPCVDVVPPMSICDGILVETISDIRPLVMALEMKPAACHLPFLASATYLRTDGGGFRTFNGHTPETWVQQVGPRAAALGVNCGRDVGIKECVEIVRQYRDNTELPIFVRPNAGTPKLENGQWLYPHGPEEMASWLPALLQAGVRMIGGCCGTTPAHIAAFKKVIDEWNRSVR